LDKPPSREALELFLEVGDPLVLRREWYWLTTPQWDDQVQSARRSFRMKARLFIARHGR
jgi:hypothetical protein